ncbi:MAG: hypothetical protein U1D00_10485, partial [Mycobacterium sp.]|nr:hypothetical protein [Mycobacterium sp.]
MAIPICAGGKMAAIGAPVLTVSEAAGLLRIDRLLAYQLADEYIALRCVSGLPVVRFGGCQRVPRWALLELALTGRVVRLCDVQVADIVDASAA